MNRQIHEAAHIIRSGDQSLNNKEEYSRCSIPTLGIQRGGQRVPEKPPAEDKRALEKDASQKRKRPRTRLEAPM